LDRNIDEFVQPYWQEISNSIVRNLNDLDNFLSLPEILETMNPLACSESEVWAVAQILDQIPPEHPFGGPQNFAHNMSANYIRQIHHILWYEQNFHQIRDQKTIVEWGGGYGLMAYFIYYYGNFDQYTIIDLPAFCTLQYLYLKQTLGEHVVSFGKSNKPINIVPVDRVDEVMDADLFISMWALSESSVEAMDYVINDRLFFGANRVITAFQSPDEKFPYATNLGKGLIVNPVPYLAGDNYYGSR
jgi:hypothetical protein